MVYPLGVKRQGPSVDVITAKKVPLMVEEDFIVVDIGVVKGDFENTMFAVF